MIKPTPGRRAFILINTLILLALTAITVYPMLYVVFASLSEPARIMAHAGLLYKPLGFSTAAYRSVLENPMILKGYQNTLFILVAGVSLNIVMTSLGAYFLSRQNVLFKNAIMALIVFTMFFSGGLVPFFLTVKSYHLDNTLFAVFVPTAINTYNLIIMRTSLQALPAELEESAKIDGAGHIRILVRIVLPLSMPIIAVMILYYGVGHWNAWFNAMVFLRNRELFPLQLILREILIYSDMNEMLAGAGVSAGDVEMLSETLKYAAIVISTLPILLLYPFLQRFFVKGIMIGALKG